MTTANDVARFIVQSAAQQGRTLTTMQLQKLLYYSQGFSLAWDGVALFDEPLEAWTHGPVVPAVWGKAAGVRRVVDWPSGNVGALSVSQRETVRAVVEELGQLDGEELRELSHREPPWLEARGDAPDGASSSNRINLDTMRAYFGQLGGAEHKRIPEDTMTQMRRLIEHYTVEEVRRMRNPQRVSQADLDAWLMADGLQARGA